MHGINRAECPLTQNTESEFVIPKEIEKSQNSGNIPIYVINAKDSTLWYSANNRNEKETPVRNGINKDDISHALTQIILHNDKTGEKNNITRLGYIVEASSELFMRNRGIVSLPTGAGKTLIIATLVEQMKNERILIVAPSLVIVGQIKALLKKINIDGNVDVLTHLTASKIEPDEIGGKPKYDGIIFDECHKMKCDTYLKSLFRSETRRIYGLSASVQKYGICSAKFHIGGIVYTLPYNVVRNFESSINGIKYFHKFEFGKQKSDSIDKLKSDLYILESEMVRLINGMRGEGYVSEMRKRQIIAQFVNMGFLLAEKNEERNYFISQILQEIVRNGLLNITFLRTKECGRILIKMMPPQSTLFWCAQGMYIYEKEGDVKLKKVEYEYVDSNFGKTLHNILATSCLQMGVNLQFTHGTINSILLLSGSTHNSLAQQVGRAVRCNPSPLPARAHTVIDCLPLLNTNATNRVKDLSSYFSLDTANELLHTEEKWVEEYRDAGSLYTN
jgi:hypothetical protein